MAEGIQIKNLPSTTAIKQGDTMTIVQDKQNKQLSLDVFANESDLATLSPLENRCDEVKAKIEVDEYSAEITTSQSMSEIGSDDSGVDLHENVLDGAFESCVLKGKTKYRDIDTGEILEDFEEGRNLELITVRMPILTTTGKNLFNIKDNTHVLTKLENGNYNVSVGIYLNLPKFKEKTSYTLSFSVSEKHDVTYQFPRIRYSDNTELISYRPNGTFNGNPAYILKSDSTKTISHIDFSYGHNDVYLEFVDFQIEEGSNSTSYEPYKTSILSCNEEVELRGIGDVTDELDLLTGEVTERIGEVILNGSEKWQKFRTMSDGTYNFVCTIIDAMAKPYGKIISNSLPVRTNVTSGVGLYLNNGASMLELSFSDLSTVEEVKSYLNNNNAIIQYQLATESVKTVGLSGYPFSYENGHVILSSGSTEPSLTPTVTYKVPVSRVGQIASNTKSNLRQTIKLDQLEILAYQSLINAEYENLLVQNSAESTASFTNLSTNDPKDELYYMLKHLIEENQPVQNMLDKINLFYLYGLLSDEHYFDLLLGGEEDVY